MNSDVDSYNVDEICRLCLKGEGTILPIFGLEHSSRDCIPLSNKIKACVSVEVDRNDELPKKICVGCVHQVDSWHKFKTVCDTAQEKLSSWIKTTERYKSTTSEIIIKQEPIDEVDDDVIICCDDDSNDDAAAYAPPQSPAFEDDRVAATVEEEQEDDHHEDSINVDDDNSRSNVVGESAAVNVNGVNEHQNPPSVVHSVYENSVEMRSASQDKSMLERALEGRIETNHKSHLDEDEMMMADFSDELAPDVNLLKDVNVDVHQNNIDSDYDIDENSGACTSLVKIEDSTLINRIHTEITRRVSADYDIEPDDFDYDDDRNPVEPEPCHDGGPVKSQNDVEVVGRVTRSSKRFDDECGGAGGRSESGMLIEAFTLSADYHTASGKRFDADPFSEGHEKLLNGAAASSSNVDPDTMTIHSSITQSDGASMIVKQEPLSPGGSDGYESSSMTKEQIDWNAKSTTAADVKPNIEELKKTGKRKYRRRYKMGKLGRIPCEPCGYTYPNYVKFIRHCQSLKHKNNVKLYESMGKPVPKEPTPEPVNPPKLDSLNPPSVTVHNGVEYHVCPIMSCSKSFKYRRNLQSHVKQTHGFSLKDLENSERRPEPIDDTYIPPEHPSGSEPPKIPPSAPDSVDKTKVFSCNICSKNFGYRRSLKQHLFISHNVTLPSPRLKCPRCMKNFQRITGLKSHMRTCGIFLKSKRCPFCEEVFPTYKDNLRHKGVCPKRYASKEKSIQSSKKMSAPEKGTYSCRFCDIMLEARSMYTDHMEMYHPGEPVDVEEESPADSEPLTQKMEDLTPGEEPKDGNVTITVSNGEVPCKFCFKTFPSLSELNTHIEEHQLSRSFECKICKSVLSSMRNFHDHMRSHFVTHSKQYLCWTCYTPFNNRSELGAHKKMHENITMKIFTCTVCKHSFHDSVSFQRHKKTHFYGFESAASEHVNSKRTLLKTIENDEREAEMADTTQPPALHCQVCKKEFSNQTALDKHSRLHKPVNSEVIKKLVQVCEVCNRSFKSRFEFRNHQPYCKQSNEKQVGETPINVPLPSFKKSIYNKIAMPHQRVQCDKCGGSFAKAIGLKKHITMNRCPLVKHDYDKAKKTYACRYCKKKLATIVGLYKHLNGCKIFISKYGKNYHSNQCPTCHKQFSSLGVLYNHARFCSGSSTALTKLIKQEPGIYKSCENCQEKFDTDELYNEHKKTCISSVQEGSSNQSFKKNCTYCDLTFDDLSSYKMHRKYCSKGESSSSSPTDSFRCEGCSRVFFQQDRLKAHLKTCKFYRQTPVVMLTKQTVIEQCECGIVFTSRSALDTHRASCAVANDFTIGTEDDSNSTPIKTKIWECQHCHRKFDKYHSRNSHLRVCKAKLKHLYEKQVSLKNQQQRQSPSASASSSRVSSTAASSNHLPPPPPMIPLSSLSTSTMSSSPSFMCSMCNSLFPTENDLILHRCPGQQPASSNTKSDSVEIMVEPDNPLNFNDFSDFGFHYMDDISQREHSQNLLKCLPCDKVFSSSVTLAKHRSLFHTNDAADTYLVKSDGSVQCPKCPRAFKDQKSMAHHMGWHTRLEDSPGQQQQISNTTNIFMQSPPPIPPSSSPNVPPYVEQKNLFSCTYCNRGFSGKGQLQNHLKTHAQQMPYPSSSSSSNSVDGDNQKPATTLTYRCRFCTKRFRDKAMMLEHQNLHKTILAAASSTTPTTSTTPKPKPAAEPVPKYLVSCNLCSKTLSSNSVAKHKKMHEMKENVKLNISTLFTAINKPPAKNELQQQYEQYQQQQFQDQYHQQQQYQQHVQQSAQQSMVPCPICYRLFSGQRSLTDHMSTEHAGYSKMDVVEIDDDDDDEQYQTNDQSHLTAATGGSVAYKCEICNLSWQHKSEYLQHVNDPSHRELTKRLSAILNRVNNDVVIN